jgi:hypothetical protein
MHLIDEFVLKSKVSAPFAKVRVGCLTPGFRLISQFFWAFERFFVLFLKFVEAQKGIDVSDLYS